MGDQMESVDFGAFTHDFEDPAPATEEEDMEDTSFNIILEQTGQQGGYHLSNPPDDPYQRRTVLERRGPVDIRCRSRVVVHGDLSPDLSDDFATLLVYDFHFNATKRFRRIASANITLQFGSSTPGATGPEVHAIAPFDRYSLLETTRKEHLEREAGAKAEAGYAGARLGGSYKWSKSASFTSNDSTRLVGATTCDKNGREVGVNWTLHENGTTKTGVPSFLRAAVVLRRRRDDEFQCTAKIDIEADWKSSLTRLFGSVEKDDPVLFNPELPPVNELGREFDKDNLGSVNVDEIFDVTFHTTITDPIKTRGGKAAS